MNQDMIIKIPIQSLSDLITNSSSEVFCEITDKNIECLYDFLKLLFPDDGWYDSQSVPTIRLRNFDDLDEYDKEERVEIPYTKWIEITMPYSMYEVEDFYVYGLKALLKDTFPDCNIQFK